MNKITHEEFGAALATVVETLDARGRPTTKVVDVVLGLLANSPGKSGYEILAALSIGLELGKMGHDVNDFFAENEESRNAVV